jgi:hypothetical protein
MKGRIVLIIAVTLLFSCVYKKKYLGNIGQINRLQKDSSLLEKRIRQLQDENNRLSTQSALIEQALNQRLQEKQDSLLAKESQLKEREFTLKDLKSRKEEEQDAFSDLAKQIRLAFSGYDSSSLQLLSNCTGVVLRINNKKLFIENSLKPDYLATEINQKTTSLLNKYADLQLNITTSCDSAWQNPKDKTEDLMIPAFNRSQVLTRQLISLKKEFNTRITAGIKPTNIALKGQPTYTEYFFYSTLLPCIHEKKYK